MRRPRVLAVLMAAALTAAGLGACSSSSHSASPQDVQSAFTATANQSSLQLKASFNGSTSDFSNSNGSGGLTQAQEQAILASTLQLTVNAADGTTLANAGTGGDVEMSLLEGTNTSPLVDLRIVDQTLYAQVDIQGLTTAYGLDSKQVTKFRSELEQLGSQVGGLSALDTGQWVSVDIGLIDNFAKTTGITLPSAPQLVARIVGAFFNSLSKGTNIQSTGANTATMTVNAQQLITDLAGAVANTPGMSTLNKQASSLADRARASVPADKSGTVSVTLGSGIVSNLSLSLNQFDTSKQLTGQVSVNMDVAKGGSVSAPSGAVPVDLAKLLQVLEGSSSSS
jgi:hypothetical protein